MDEAESEQGEVPMSLAIAVLKEQAEGECRVALDPISNTSKNTEINIR